MSTDKVQGEGDYEAARRYDEAQKRFVESGKVEQAAEDAAPESAEQAQELERAEDIGRSRSKGEDPNATTTEQSPDRPSK